MKGLVDENGKILVEVLMFMVFFAFGAAMLLGASKPVAGSQNWVCSIIPCPFDKTAFYTQTANESAEAVWCAINSVAMGKTDESERCIKYVEGKAPQQFAKDANDKVIKSTAATFSCSVGKVDKKVDEAKGSFSCVVTQFELPQDVSKTNKLLPGYGDPKYLVYFNEFPDGEDESWSTWAAVNVLLTVIPVGKIPIIGKFAEGIIMKPLKLLGKGVLKLGSKTIEWAGGKLALRAAEFEIKENGEIFVKGMLKSAAGKIVGNSVIWYDGAEAAIEKTLVSDIERAAVKEGIEKTGVGIAGKTRYYALTWLARAAEKGRLKYFSDDITKMWVKAANKAGLLTDDAVEYLVNNKIIENKGLIAFVAEEEQKVLANEFTPLLQKLSKSGVAQQDIDQIVTVLEKSLKSGGVSPMTAQDLIELQKVAAPSLAQKLVTAGVVRPGVTAFILTPKYILVGNTVGEGLQSIDEVLGQKYLAENIKEKTLLFKDADQRIARQLPFTQPISFLETVKLRKPVLEKDKNFYLASPCKADLYVWKSTDTNICKDGKRSCVLVNVDFKDYGKNMDANFCYTMGGPIGGGFLGLTPWPCHGVAYLDQVPLVSDFLDWIGVGEKC
jgi:hypothetical protein